jgi:CheY-like chemotaxis protein
MYERDWKGKTLLIAEDEKINYLFLKALFDKTGAEILWARDGQEAIDMCKAKDHIDIVLMDLKMPGVDGNEATRQIKAYNPQIIIIAQTSFSYRNDRILALEAGCDTFLSKPVKPDNLLATVEKFIDGTA